MSNITDPELKKAIELEFMDSEQALKIMTREEVNPKVVTVEIDSKAELKKAWSDQLIKAKSNKERHVIRNELKKLK